MSDIIGENLVGRVGVEPTTKRLRESLPNTENPQGTAHSPLTEVLESTPEPAAFRDPLRDLTRTQQAVFEFIRIRIAQGAAPTRAEISEHMGWASPNAAESMVHRLAKKGVIRLLRGEKRGIRIPSITETLCLPPRTPTQLQAIEVRKIWDQEGCHCAQFPEALTALLDMVLG